MAPNFLTARQEMHALVLDFFKGDTTRPVCGADAERTLCKRIAEGLRRRVSDKRSIIVKDLLSENDHDDCKYELLVFAKGLKFVEQIHSACVLSNTTNRMSLQPAIG